jgi:hypothetical protein
MTSPSSGMTMGRGSLSGTSYPSARFLHVPIRTNRTTSQRAKVHEVAESVFNRNQRRAAEIDEALKQEDARHAAVVKNMHRLRALRLARSAKHQSTERAVKER